MNKRIKFFISLLLIFALFVSVFCFPASSYENDIETSTADMLLINMDTDTVVFSQKPDNKWYAGYLSELMTFLLAVEKIKEADKVEYKVEQSFIDGLPYSDGCLDKFVGKTLTAKDLAAIMLLTSGNDAAYALADIVSEGDIDAFVADMNAKAAELGMKKTKYASPGYNDTTGHVTTCRDLYTLYREINKVKFFNQVMQNRSYTPEGLDEETYTVNVETSILNSKSPYYFRYTSDAMYSYTEATYAGIALTTTYHDKTYFFAGLLGLHESEKNVYADAKKLTTWAYTNLSDRKIISAEDSMSGVTVNTDWGRYTVGLYSENSSYKTVPNTYEEDKLAYSFDIPKSVNTPLIAGQSVGKAVITYDGEKIDNLKLVVNEDEGLGMIHDLGRFGRYAYANLMAASDLTPTYEVQTKSLSDAASKQKKESESSDKTKEKASKDKQAETKAPAAAATEG